jgi:hypothetical protein
VLPDLPPSHATGHPWNGRVQELRGAFQGLRGRFGAIDRPWRADRDAGGLDPRLAAWIHGSEDHRTIAVTRKNSNIARMQ